MGYIICEWEFCSNLLWAHHSGASWRSHKIKKVVYWAMKKSRVVLKFEGCAQKNGIISFFWFQIIQMNAEIFVASQIFPPAKCGQGLLARGQGEQHVTISILLHYLNNPFSNCIPGLQFAVGLGLYHHIFQL